MSKTTRIGVGYVIDVNAGGLAAVSLDTGRSFEIAPGEATITAADTVQLVTGTVLAELSAPATVDFPGASAQGSTGVFRVDGAGPTRVAVYSGSASVSVPGTTVSVPAFREVAVGNGQISGPAGLRLVGTGDAIDQQFLSSAISLESQLNSFANGLDAQLGTATGSAFFGQVLPTAVDVSYAEPFFSQPRSDVLIGWDIASSVASATQADVGTTFDAVMVLWLQGEPWGVIADEYKVSADAIFNGLNNDIGRLKLAVAPQPTSSGESEAEETPRPKTSSPPTKPGATVTPNQTPTPIPSGLAALLNPVTGLLGQILNLLLPSPTPAPSPGG
ncbi:MAG TPA: hypothetical protein VHA57_08415 [Actinomycetota bacterium]|nr:hypothetical protein [Actinomycetota bacterium]